MIDEHDHTKEEISAKHDPVIYSLGVLKWKIYECITEDHVIDEVIITREQLKHIEKRHPDVFFNVIDNLREVLNDPDYIIRDNKRPNTGLVMKQIQSEQENLIRVLKIVTASDQKSYKNSIITSWKMAEKRLNNYLRNKDIIYKRE